MKSSVGRFAIGLLPLLLSPVARACAVCFGSDSPDLAKGFFWGVVVLLVLPPALILSFAGFIVYNVHRNRRASLTQAQ
jgi:hypothetical protein